MTILPQLERDLDTAARTRSPAGEAPGPGRRGHRFGTGLSIALPVAIGIAIAAVGLSLRHGSGVRTHAGPTLVAVGLPVPVHSVQGEAGTGTLQLQAVGPRRSSPWRLLAALVKPIAREPDDVCFDVFAVSAGPRSEDVLCSVRGPGRLVSVIGQSSVPGAGTLSYLVGQAPPGAIRVQMTGMGGTRKLPLSAAHMFLATFKQLARGPVALRATLSDGQTLTDPFTLPLSDAQMQAFSDRFRRPGAVFNGEIGENIVGTPYRRLVRRFGRPLATLSDRDGERCVYYDVVGYARGWSFCFKRSTMTAADGNQIPPRGIH